MGDIERVVVINDDSTRSGGAAEIALESVRLLRSREIPVVLLAGDETRDPELAALGVQMVGLGGTSILDDARARAASRGIYDPGPRAALARWIAAHDTPGTVYHLHNWHKRLSPSIFLALRPVDARLVFSQHDYFLACPNGGYFNYPERRQCELQPMSAACLTSACDKRSYSHKLWRVARHALRSRTFDAGGSRATLLAVHEGMLPLLARGVARSATIEVLRNPATPWCSTRVVAESNRLVLFVGRLDADKGILVLAEAARRAGCRLRVIGDGPLREQLARDYPEIELLGFRSREELEVDVRAARCLVVPTLWRETFGLTIVEGLASGIPVIVTATSFFAEDIERAEMGLVVPTGDVDGLARQLRLVMQDGALIARMSRAGSAHGQGLAHTPTSWCDELLAIYRRKLAMVHAL